VNVFSDLQESIITRLTAPDQKVPSLTPHAGQVNWVSEDIGDLANVVLRATGKVGIIGIVVTPGGGKLYKMGIFPISFRCPIEIQIQENVTVNRGDAGTQISALDLVQFCMLRLHLWSPTNQRITNIEADETPFALVSDTPLLVYNVRFNAKLTVA
jgi:hypothetical protein